MLRPPGLAPDFILNPSRSTTITLDPSQGPLHIISYQTMVIYSTQFLSPTQSNPPQEPGHGSWVDHDHGDWASPREFFVLQIGLPSANYPILIGQWLIKIFGYLTFRKKLYLGSLMCHMHCFPIYCSMACPGILCFLLCRVLFKTQTQQLFMQKKQNLVLC